MDTPRFTVDSLFQCDWLELMRCVPDGVANLVLSDLPYGVTACEWDNTIDLTLWWQECRRILAPRGAVVMTATQPFTTDLIVSNRKWYRHEWIWVKNNSAGFMLAKIRPFQIHESVLIFAPTQPVYNPEMTKGKLVNKSGSTVSENYKIKPQIYLDKSEDYYPKSLLYFTNTNNRGVLHPTQKPVALFEYLIRTYTNEGDLVLDPFIGSGTTAVAAKLNNRHYLGSDLSAEYLEIARRRLHPTFGEKPRRGKVVLPLGDLPMFRDLNETEDQE